MEKYRIKFSYEKIEGEGKLIDKDIEISGFAIDVTNGVAEVVCVAEGNGVGETLKEVGRALESGREERLERSIETMIAKKKREGIEIKRIRWVD